MTESAKVSFVRVGQGRWREKGRDGGEEEERATSSEWGEGGQHGYNTSIRMCGSVCPDAKVTYSVRRSLADHSYQRMKPTLLKVTPLPSPLSNSTHPIWRVLVADQGSRFGSISMKSISVYFQNAKYWMLVISLFLESGPSWNRRPFQTNPCTDIGLYASPCGPRSSTCQSAFV